MWIVLLRSFLGALLFSPADFQLECTWNKPDTLQELHSQPEFFYVNMDRSVERMKTIKSHLDQVGFLHRRVKGLTLDDMYIPHDVLSSWDDIKAKTITDEKIPARADAPNTPDSPYYKKYHVIAGLYGRRKKNVLKEIGCTASHLTAIREAVHNNRTSSRYAVIVEDDIQIPFNIDFEALVKTAPEGFGILQLFNSNEESMESTWKRYIKSGGGDPAQLWTERRQKQAGAYWSTCAYLIDREVLRPVIDKVAYEHRGWVYIKIIAGIFIPCRPKFTECCWNYTSDSMIPTELRNFQPPCFWSAKGFQADSFIYSMVPSYVLSVPLITNSRGGNESTFHQDHVENIHQSAFTRQRKYINELIAGTAPLPKFASLACKEAITTGMTLNKRANCVYDNKTLPALAAKGAQQQGRGVASTSAALYSSSSSSSSSSVKHHTVDTSNIPAVYWLNRAGDTDERTNMEQYLNTVILLPNKRVEALTEDHLHLPADVAAAWPHRNCVYQTETLQTVRSGESQSPQGEHTSSPSSSTSMEKKARTYASIAGSSKVAAEAGAVHEEAGADLLDWSAVLDIDEILIDSLDQSGNHGLQSTETDSQTASSAAGFDVPDSASSAASAKEPPHNSSGRGRGKSGHSSSMKPRVVQVMEHIEPNKRVFVSGLCGRGKGRNSLSDLALTVSHLIAMHTAIYHNVTASRYAIIAEDDVKLPFNVDFQKLALSAIQTPAFPASASSVSSSSSLSSSAYAKSEQRRRAVDLDRGLAVERQELGEEGVGGDDGEDMHEGSDGEEEEDGSRKGDSSSRAKQLEELESELAPFGILRLFVANEGALHTHWNTYRTTSFTRADGVDSAEKQQQLYDQNRFENLWSTHHMDRYYDDWSTKVYVIDRVAMKPVVDRVLKLIAVVPPASEEDEEEKEVVVISTAAESSTSNAGAPTITSSTTTTTDIDTLSKDLDSKSTNPAKLGTVAAEMDRRSGKRARKQSSRRAFRRVMWDVKIIAGLHSPCIPAQCCGAEARQSLFSSLFGATTTVEEGGGGSFAGMTASASAGAALLSETAEKLKTAASSLYGDIVSIGQSFVDRSPPSVADSTSSTDTSWYSNVSSLKPDFLTLNNGVDSSGRKISLSVAPLSSEQPRDRSHATGDLQEGREVYTAGADVGERMSRNRVVGKRSRSGRKRHKQPRGDKTFFSSLSDAFSPLSSSSSSSAAFMDAAASRDSTRALKSKHKTRGSDAQQTTGFFERAPCMVSKSGFTADKYIFSLSPRDEKNVPKTLVLNIPLFTANLNGIFSKLHGEKHQDYQRGALRVHERLMSQLIMQDNVKLPDFVQTACLDI